MRDFVQDLKRRLEETLARIPEKWASVSMWVDYKTIHDVGGRDSVINFISLCESEGLMASHYMKHYRKDGSPTTAKGAPISQHYTQFLVTLKRPIDENNDW
jgi:hypothetical protein